jgi:hypothetical protein
MKEHAFSASISNLDHDSNNTSSSLSDKELNRWVEDKLNGMFLFDDTIGGLCTMALGEYMVGVSDKDNDDDSTSKVSLFANDLTIEEDDLMSSLASWKDHDAQEGGWIGLF